ncbi:hypothetical protein niasHS_008613 [Heterodera schachtii]|uniref:ATP-dependent DNA helicase n=1 Tax=Heterodera schachtii TaxID=97005 RepID=A0ABD2IW48_HETSC
MPIPTVHGCHACPFAKPSGSNCSRVPRLPIPTGHGCHACPFAKPSEFQLSTGATHAHSNCSRVPRMPIRQALGFQLLLGCHACPFKLLTGATHAECLSRQIRDKDNMLLDADEDLGEDGEFLGAEQEQQFHRRDQVSRSQWFRYMAHIRGLNYNWRDGHWLWDWRALAQLYTISFNNRMEAQKVQFMKQHQGYEGDIGRVFMTDEHFRGSRQYYQREYANCMTICREVGKPDLLVTFTMDPECPELEEMLPTDPSGQRQQWYDRPDIICRLFIDKLNELHHDLTYKEVMGPIRGWFYSLEHQKRGLPHVHFALILDWDRVRSGGVIMTPEDYIGQYISAEIPENPSGRSPEVTLRRQLYNTITTMNIHTCSARRCIVDGKCTKHFPRPFSYDNVYSENAYPRYRRRPTAPTEKAAAENPDNYGQAFQYKDKSGKMIRVDNRQVVPFNTFLSAKYKSHINTEFVAGEGCTKYLCKYVMKGADMAFIEVKGGPEKQQKVDYDEFHQIRLARYITSMEAFLSLNGTKLVRRSHEVDELDVHGPSGHRIAVEFGLKDDEEDLNAVCEAAQAEEDRRARGEERVTQLTAYFAFNKDNPPLGLTYARCNKKLWYDIAKKQWKPYVNRVVPKFCRLKTVSPNNRELLAIRLLLLVVCDPTGWEALRTHDGIVYGSFIEAAKARGLLSDNDLWMNTITDAFQTKKSIRQRIRWLAISMQNKDVLEFVDRLLRSVAQDKLKEIPFAGKVVVIGGDWKQLTPVIPGGSDRHQLEASVKNSTLFVSFTTVRLRANHRLLPGQHHYRAFLKRLGTGTINDSQGRVKLPSVMGAKRPRPEVRERGAERSEATSECTEQYQPGQFLCSHACAFAKPSGSSFSTGATHVPGSCYCTASRAFALMPRMPIRKALGFPPLHGCHACPFQLFTGSNCSRVPCMPIRQALGFQLLTGATHADWPSPRVPTAHGFHACPFHGFHACPFQLSTGVTHAQSNCSRVPRVPIRQALGFQLLTGATHAHSNCSRVPRMPIRQALAFQLLTGATHAIRQALGFQLLTGATHAHSNWSRVPRMPMRQALGFQLSTGATHAHSNCSRVPRMPIRQALGFQLSTGATHAHSNCSRVPRMPIRKALGFPLKHGCHACPFQLFTGATHAHSKSPRVPTAARVPRMPIQTAHGCHACRMPFPVG